MSSLSTTGALLFIIMADFLLRSTHGKHEFLEGLVSQYLKQEGKLTMEGRTITYQATVRPQSFPHIYDGMAQDTATGLISTAENFHDPQEAYQKAVDNLLGQLRHRGLIKDQTPRAEADSSQSTTAERDQREGVSGTEPTNPSLPAPEPDMNQPPSDGDQEAPPSQPSVPGQDALPREDGGEDQDRESEDKDQSKTDEDPSLKPSDPLDPTPSERISDNDENEEEGKEGGRSDKESTGQDKLQDAGQIQQILLLFVICSATAILKCIQSLGRSFVFVAVPLVLAVASIYGWEGRGFEILSAIVVATIFLLFTTSSVPLQRVAAVFRSFVKPSRRLSAVQNEDMLLEVKPDCQGSYEGYVMQAARPTAAMLSPRNAYKMWSSTCKGLAYILNNRDFDRGKRLGSEIDVDNMKHLFHELGYEIVQHSDLTGEEIQSSVKSFAAMFNVEGACYDSAVVVLMSHGDTGVILGTDLAPVKLQDLKQELEAEKCPGLEGKPKLYFIQACRLSSNLPDAIPVVADGPTTQSDTTGSSRRDRAEVTLVQPDNLFISRIKDKADVHFAFATVDGHWSLRSEAVGSFFVQALCEVFFASAHMDNLDTLMNKVTDRVDQMRGYLYDNKTKKKILVKQTPECVKSMRKALYFLPKYAKKRVAAHFGQ